MNRLNLKLNPTHATVVTRTFRAFLSRILWRSKVGFPIVIKSYKHFGNSYKTKFVCSLFVGVQYCQITKPCLCGKWQIWVAKVKKMYFTIRKSAGADEPPSPNPCVVPEKIRANGTTLLRIIFFPRRRQSVMRYWMYSSFIQAWNLNNTSVHVSLRVIKWSFQNYGKPGHVIWILN